MTGSLIGWSGHGKTQEEQRTYLRRMDRLTRLNQEAQNPIFWAIGIGAAVIVFGSLGLYLAGRMAGRPGKVARYGLRVVSAWPLALLLAPLADPHSVGVYVAVFAALTGLLALLPSPPLICALTALVIVGDGLTGTTLISNSALSEYALSGIRFYGIGNEYMGVLIGGALLACVVGPSPKEAPPAPNSGEAGKEGAMNRAPTGASPLAPPELRAGGVILLWLALTAFVLSFPRVRCEGRRGDHSNGDVCGRLAPPLGEAGGLEAPGGKHHCRVCAGLRVGITQPCPAFAADALGDGGGCAGTGAFRVYCRGQPAEDRPGRAGRAASGDAAGPAGLWAALAGRPPVFVEGDCGLPRAGAALCCRMGGGLWGCVVAVLFNDSGIVAAILMLQCLVLSLLHGLFLEKMDAPAGA